MTKILIDEATVKLALEALEYIEHNYMSLPAPAEKAITSLREALTSVPDWASEAKEQPAPVAKPHEQEPVAWTNWRELVGARHYRTPGWEMYADKRNPDDVAIYTSPPAQRKPLKLWTEAQHERAYRNSPELHKDVKSLAAFKRVAKEIAAMYGIKENT